MALSILDGNQSATTLSSVVTGGEHIVAHSVVSLGSNAISNITTAISGSTVCVGNLGLLQSTVATDGSIASVNFIKIGGHTGTSTTGNIVHVSSIGAMKVDGSSFTQPVSISSVTIGNTVTIAGTVTANPTGTQTIAGTVTIGAGTAQIGSVTASLAYSQTATTISSTAVTAIPVVFPTSGAYGGSLQGYNGTNTYIYSGIQAIGNTSLASATSLPVSLGTLPALVAGTAQIGSVTASISGTVPVSGTFYQATQPVSLTTLPALVAGTAQIGSVTASISGTVPVSGTFFQATQPVSLTTLPALVAGTAQIGSVTASISNSVVTFYPAQGTTVTNSNFTSTTASTTLVSAVAGREVLTVFNEGPTLYISPGATCTTISYQVRLSAGDYWECPQGQLSLAHTAVFATAGTARVTEVS